jgi:hypothetical protein
MNSHEEMFNLHPVGVRYICEFCNDGEMQVSEEEVNTALLGSTPLLISHKCNKCGKTMQLPRSYPYVKFMTDDEYNSYFL